MNLVKLYGLPVLTRCDVTLSVAGKEHLQPGRQRMHNDATSFRRRAYSGCTMSTMPTTVIALNVLPITERSDEM